MEETKDNSLKSKRLNNPIYQVDAWYRRHGQELAERAKKNPYGILEDENK
jgi:hypothetical protein